MLRSFLFVSLSEFLLCWKSRKSLPGQMKQLCSIPHQTIAMIHFVLLLLTLAALIIAGRPVLWQRSTPGTPLLWILVLEIHVSSLSDRPQQEVAVMPVVVSMDTKEGHLQAPLKCIQIRKCSTSLAYFNVKFITERGHLYFRYFNDSKLMPGQHRRRLNVPHSKFWDVGTILFQGMSEVLRRV